MPAANQQAGIKSKIPLLMLAGMVVVTILATLGLRPPPVTPIRIGVLQSLTGTMAVSSAPLVDAVRLAAEEINAGGGLLGRPVELVVADGRSDTDILANEAERLITQENVSLLVACWTSACRKTVKPVVERHRHLMLYPVQYEGLEQSPNILYTGSAPNQQIIPGTRWALEHFGKRVYLLGSNYIFPHAANLMIGDITAASNGRILAERYLPLGAPPDSAMIDEIRRLQPDVILNTLNGDSNLHFFRALHDAGLGKIPVLSFSVSEVELAAMGETAFHPAHYAVWSYFQSLPSDANRQFVSAFKARFGSNRVTSDPIEATYSGVMLWARAVSEAGTDAPEHVNRTIGRQSIPGPSGVTAVDAATRHLWKPYRIGQARQDGQFSQITASEDSIRPTPYPGYRGQVGWQQIIAELENSVEWLR